MCGGTEGAQPTGNVIRGLEGKAHSCGGKNRVADSSEARVN